MGPAIRKSPIFGSRWSDEQAQTPVPGYSSGCSWKFCSHVPYLSRFETCAGGAAHQSPMTTSEPDTPTPATTAAIPALAAAWPRRRRLKIADSVGSDTADHPLARRNTVAVTARYLLPRGPICPPPTYGPNHPTLVAPLWTPRRPTGPRAACLAIRPPETTYVYLSTKDFLPRPCVHVGTPRDISAR